jgi:O-antigen/teichoic acid export membrane protein
VTQAAAPPASSTSRDTAIVLGSTLLSLLGSVGTQSCLAWFLEPAGRGAFAVCVTFASVAAVVFGLATDRALQYHVIARQISPARASVLAWTTTLGSSAVASLVCWLLIDSSHPFFTKAAPESFRLSLLLIPLLALAQAFNLLLGGIGRFAALGALGLLGTGANLLLTLLLVGALGLGVGGAIWALVLATALSVALQSGAFVRYGGGLEWPRLADLGRLASYGLRYYVARLGNVVNLQIGMIVMAWVAPQEEIGLFAAASVLISRAMVIPDSLSAALQPRVGPQAAGQPELVAAAARASLVSVGGGLLLLLAASGVVVPILLSQAFVGAIPLLWWMAPGLWLKAASKPTTSYFIGLDRPGVVSLSTSVELAANVVFLPILYRRFGPSGAAAATSLACALASLVLVVAFHTASGLGVRKTWWPRRSELARLLDPRRWVQRGLPTPPPPVSGASVLAPARRFELLPDRVVKHRQGAVIAVEAEKTAQGARIGAATGLFRGPRVIEVDASRGWLAVERIDGLVSLHDALQTGRAGEPLVEAAGRALAAIHERLSLPASMHHPVAAAWSARDAGVDVAIHGDFNTRNLFVEVATGTLVVTDWETSSIAHVHPEDALTQIATIGPRYFDVAWFVASLFGRTWFGLGRISNASGYAESFLRSYFVAAGPAARPEGFARYLARFADPLEASESTRYPRFDRVFHPRSRIVVACGALRALAASLAARSAERTWAPALDG